MINKLNALLEEAKIYRASLAALPEVLEDYPTLIKAVEKQDLEAELLKLEAMIHLVEEQAIKMDFSRLCLEREQQNQLTRLDFMANPANYCNQLYFNCAKVLYPDYSFQLIFKILMPSIRTQLVVGLTIRHQDVKQKRRRIELVQLTEQDIDDPSSILAALPLEFRTLMRLVKVNQMVLSLDEIISFDFDRYQQLVQQIMDHYPAFQQAVAMHNQALSKLCSVIRRIRIEGATHHDILFPLAEKMGVSGQSSGNGYFASEQGSELAYQFITYYDNLPETLKDALGQCRSADGTVLENVVQDIKDGKCIETAASQALSIIKHPINQQVLGMSLCLNEATKKELLVPYLETNHSPMVDVDGCLSTTSLPSSLCKPFYNLIQIRTINQWTPYLVNFPPDEYLQLLNETKFNGALINYLVIILTVLDTQQHQALVDAVVKSRFVVPLKVLALINSGEDLAAEKLLSGLSTDEFIAMLKSVDRTGKTVQYLSLQHPKRISLYLDLFLKAGRGVEYREVLMTDIHGKTALDSLLDNPEAFEVFLKYLENDQNMGAIALRNAISIEDWCKTLRHLHPIDVYTCSALYLLTTETLIPHFRRLLKLYPQLYEAIPTADWYAPCTGDNQGVFENTSPFYQLTRNSGGQIILKKLFEIKADLLRAIPAIQWCRPRHLLNNAESNGANASPLFWFCFSADSQGIFQKRLNIRPSIFTKKLLKYWYMPHRTNTGGFDNTSALYWLCAHDRGRSILISLMNLSDKSRQLFADIPVTAWSLCCTPKTGLHKNRSPLFWLSSTASGQIILRRLMLIVPEFLSHIPVKIWFLYPLDGALVPENKPPIAWLAQSSEGREILFQLLKDGLLNHSGLFEQLTPSLLSMLEAKAPDVMQRIGMLSKALASETNAMELVPPLQPSRFFERVKSHAEETIASQSSTCSMQF